MVNAEDTLKQKLIESLYVKYFKDQCQAYIKYANRTLTGLIQNLQYDHWTTSLMGIDDS